MNYGKDGRGVKHDPTHPWRPRAVPPAAHSPGQCRASGSAGTALLRSDPQFILSDPQQDLIPGLDAQRPAEGSRNDDTTILAYTDSGLFLYGTLQRL
jgi:hypothetical protein